MHSPHLNNSIPRKQLLTFTFEDVTVLNYFKLCDVLVMRDGVVEGSSRNGMHQQ